jgi:CBS domain containing-hemolysin-like protein
MQVLLMILLVAMNAFFVAAEMGLMRIRRSRIDQLAEEGNRTAQYVQHELDNPEKFVSACQLGITLATLALGAVGEKTFAGEAAETVKNMGVLPQASLPFAQTLCYVMAFSITAFFQTLFGELVPKVFTLERAEPVLFTLIHPMRLWCKLTTPFLYFLNGFTTLIFRMFNIQAPPRRHYVHSGEELRMLVSASQEEGVIEEEAEEMLHSVFDFSETTADDIMTPRTDMICLPANATIQEFVDLALKHGHSRLPVYEEDIDSIFGMVHIRDALRAIVEHKSNGKLRELVRKVLIVPENKDAGDLLTEFKKTKTHMAIVVDEYGGTRGMVTMEDLIEELVGDIADEHEIVEEYIQQLPDGTCLLDARMDLYDVNEKLHLEIEDEQFNTLGGHVFGVLGREPKVGDEISTDRFILRVEESDRHRILKLKLIIKQPLEHGEKPGTDGNGKTIVPPDGQSQPGSKPIETTK